MLTRLSVAHQFFCAGVEVLLAAAQALDEWLWSRPVEDLDAGARSFRDFDAVQARMFVRPAGADRPKLARRQRIAADAVLAMQLGRHDKLLHAILTHVVTEMRVAKLGGADAFLL